MIEYGDNTVVLTGGDAFSPEKTFLCGQCFRFEAGADGEFTGIARGRSLRVGGDVERTVLYCGKAEFEAVWRGYFDAGNDYGRVRQLIEGDAFLCAAEDFGRGIRILRQEPWEALCSFLISQCNNIPRIRQIVSALCERFGEAVGGGFAFPTPERLAELDEAALAPVRAGYRAAYLLAAARAVCGGTLDLAAMEHGAYETAELREMLMRQRGVGRKVADCVLLYGLGRPDAFPQDVWIKRALAARYPDGLDTARFGAYAGIIQQYIFYYAREHRLHTRGEIIGGSDGGQYRFLPEATPEPAHSGQAGAKEPLPPRQSGGRRERPAARRSEEEESGAPPCWRESAERQAESRYPCPCCKNRTYPVPPEDDVGYICPVCFWENDPFIRSEDEPSDQNHGMTLTEARQNYAAFGACRRDFVRCVRKPLKNERRR